ncbi:putative glycosyltransferase [Apostasia shenzhenica]|uniref:Putative glycosyltransferase n=1 Tax=Apostasia shenzhenica TaxID=1088818 RepID=A0A2H9ZVH2_9ASPA|nr:putative glycosyltransferase [Apostasia shenzhenica]
MEGHIAHCRRVFRARRRKLVSTIVLLAMAILVLRTFTVLSRTAFSTKFPSSSHDKDFSYQSIRYGKLTLLSDLQKDKVLKDKQFRDDADLGNDEDPKNGFFFDNDKDSVGGIFTLKRTKERDEKSNNLKNGFDFISDGNGEANLPLEKTEILDNELVNIQSLSVNSRNLEMDSVAINSSTSGSLSNSTTLGKKQKWVMPPLSISELNSLLLKNRASRRSMRPRWSSELDKQMLVARKEIENAPVVKHDGQLFAPLFRNFFKFKRSYELMENTLKIYIYEEGEKPIYHQPFLTGIYASEGWFMKLMETNAHYVIKDPTKAHLFYMPFSSRLLQFALYRPRYRGRTNSGQFPDKIILREHLKNYVLKISTKYPFWNRTGGTDHFLAACHDWAVYETRKVMDRSIRALCVADLRVGFQLGKDVSLPETYVRYSKNPLKDLGGRPWNRRLFLAFFAGNLHGELRSILLQHWENKDPDMKIFSPASLRANKSKMNYIQYMKNSKYCICPRGYEANSPRLVESIFFECVPVIISDNYIPPFFELLNWEKFSVIVPEKDVFRLKEILVSISESEYRELQMGVKKVQQHFLWHNKPVKYDLFHMILHSVWHNRVYNIKPR